jgi:hypothetical protein
MSFKSQLLFNIHASQPERVYPLLKQLWTPILLKLILLTVKLVPKTIDEEEETEEDDKTPTRSGRHVKMPEQLVAEMNAAARNY